MLKVLLYIRALLFIPFVILLTFICSVLVIASLLLRLPRSVVDLFICKIWCGLMVQFSGLNVVVEGAENVPKDSGFLYLFTHSSHMDIPVMFYKSPKSFRFGAKSSLFKIPVFGAAIRLAGTLPITRDDRSKVMEVYRQAEKRVAQGEAFALAPEGGRRKGQEIMEFKSGPFIFAINAKMPIVPVVLCGVGGCLKKGSIMVNTDRLSRKVGMRILPAISLKNVSLDQVKEFKNQLRDKMVSEYQDMKTIYN